jgi:hypothetical protein
MGDVVSDTRELMPSARYLLVAEETDGVFLVRRSETGEFCGDTWHTSIEDAKHQVEYEFETAGQEWVAVPVEESDWLGFAKERFG